MILGTLKDCVGFSDSLVFQQQVKARSGGYLGHGGEGIGGKELRLRLSEVQIVTRHGGERDCCRMRRSCSAAAGGVCIQPRCRNNGAQEKLHGPEVNLQLSTINIILECRLSLLLLVT